MNYARRYPRFWLGYLVLCVLVFASNVVAAVFGIPRALGPGDVIGLAFTFLGFWPLYGFVRQRRYNPRWLWILFLSVSTVGVAGAVIACVLVVLSQPSVLPIAMAVAIAGLGGPYVFALHQYLFRSAHLWQ